MKVLRMRLLGACLLAPFLAAASATAQDGARTMFYNPASGTMTRSPDSAAPAPPPPSAPAKPSAPVKPSAPAKPSSPELIRSGSSRPSRPLPAIPAAGVKFVGVHYWLDLETIGIVSDQYTFATGERIRLNIRSNVDGYLVVWALPPDGKPAVLLPSTGDASGISINAGQEYISPPIRFRPPVRDEQLLLVFARQRSQLPSLETVEGKAAVAAFASAGARDLVVETEEKAPGEIGTYVVNRQGGPVVRQIRLKHIRP